MKENAMKKLCFVVQRYGREVNGGAEALCRSLAERLVSRYDVTVLTTCAIDYITWKNEYPAGEEMIDGVRVLRFPNDTPRDINKFGKFYSRYDEWRGDEKQEQRFVQEQGPICTRLLTYLKENSGAYDCFAFMTYLYYTTTMGLPLVAEKSILISTAHDEPPIYMSIFNKIFNLPKAFYFLTEKEREFVQDKFQNSHIPYRIGGAGVDLPDIPEIDIHKRFGFEGDYMVYVGRIEPSKGCPELFEFYQKYRDIAHKELKLLLIGKNSMDIPNTPGIIAGGFVSEEEKYAAIRDAAFLVMPSQWESLSIVVLEAFALGVPVLANGKCEVLKSHCLTSNGGLFYTNYEEFSGCVEFLSLQRRYAKKMGEQGRNYQQTRYTWPAVLDSLSQLVELVSR